MRQRNRVFLDLTVLDNGGVLGSLGENYAFFSRCLFNYNGPLDVRTHKYVSSRTIKTIVKKLLIFGTSSTAFRQLSKFDCHRSVPKRDTILR